MDSPFLPDDPAALERQARLLGRVAAAAPRPDEAARFRALAEAARAQLDGAANSKKEARRGGESAAAGL